MASETRRLWIRLLLQYFAVYALVFATTLAGHFWVVSNGYEPLPALLRLREPMFAIYEVAIPMILGTMLVKYFAVRAHLTHIIWREPEYVLPKNGGKAPTYAPPLDTSDDLLLGTALSSEPEPLYEINVQPRISRLWWLAGTLATLGALIVITFGLADSEVTPTGAITGLFAAFCWAFTQEYLLRGLVIAQARNLSRTDAKPLLASLLLSILWMIPIATTAPSLTNGVILVILGPVLGAGTFALRRMFTTLWAAIAAQFLFISAFYVLI